jgi:translocator protein
MDETIATLPAWLAPLGLLAAVASAAAAGILFRPGAWYKTLAKPSWTPPDRLFPLAWTVLYLMMAAAAWVVARSGHPSAPSALALWSWQIVLNALWSPVFFGIHRIRSGALVISLLWLAVLATIWAFFQVSGLAGLLMLPYLVWISYALGLNLAIWRLNPPGPRAAHDEVS